MKKRLVKTVGLVLVSTLILTRCCFLPWEDGIDPEIQPHVDKFYEEAKARGVSLRMSRSEINVCFRNVPGSAQGRTITATKTIFIERGSIGWQYNPEALVFHELGHLILKRDHLNDRVNLFCISIMSNQDDPVYDYNEGDRLYYRRQYYIDELFSPGIQTPKWMNDK